MAFNIVFYNNTSPMKKLDKSLTLVTTLSGTLKEECNLVDPSILIESATVPTGNYAYIEAFGRYYYVRKVTSVRANLWRVDMHVDVYMTYKSKIRTNTAILERAQGYYNLYLPDNRLSVQEDTFDITYSFGTTFSNSNVIVQLTDASLGASS